jgi:hypothetical protein
MSLTPFHRNLLVATIAIAIILVIPSTSRAQNQNGSNSGTASGQSSDGNFSAGINLGKDASAKDVGLPLYPGSHRHQDTSDDSASLNMGLWGGSSGFKMVMLKMDSTDSPDKIAAFYRKALSKYGKVLTCSGPGSDSAAAQNSSGGDSKDAAKSTNLSCDNDKPDKSEIELKAGTKEKQHVVGIKPEGTVNTYTLIYIETRGLDDDKK